VKEFVVYTLLRLALLAASFAVVLGIWLLVADSAPIVWILVISFVISGLASYVLLDKQRTAFAQRVDERARRASEKFEEMRAREDAD
jgi:ABC-type bacteriocin/lantibiotic exporter with double-glycine peptidase domain